MKERVKEDSKGRVSRDIVSQDIEVIGDVLKREIIKGARRRRAVDAKVRAKWDEVVGEEIARRTSPISFRAHVLRIRVESSALLGELSGIYKRELLSTMAEGDNAVSVRTIEFELAGASDLS